ncbi:decaprenyl-phosphate phosphoribosyltransferase [Methanobacterium formicicum]|uniref:UbiA prenyltransferase n=1 Tax=Methanobacterium formicicum (strain DSM 3637 / PP1) TaxID=1204725 RepID=K2R530_METFP|nr:decaprenyl-phosphate phosphoribosyltransferase [Methanobacterium formicicum]EKF86302.1 UbiA prenyltransferase [Methanobacterium formicicum DSM 3637]
MLKDILVSMRPKQWYKNLVIFIGIIFSINLLNLNLWIEVIAAFTIFCILSGSIYVLNDILDLEKDKNHPKKKNRPLASGRLKVSHALTSAIILIFIALTGAYLLNLQFFMVSVAFFILMLVYSFFLKEIIIVDIMVISIGFVLRAMAGALAIGVYVSPWLIICAFLLALFLALGKRRHELVLLKENASNHRKILGEYSTDMLDQMINITTSALIMSYSLYTFFSGNIYIMITIPFAFYGLFRYIFLVHARNMGGEPEMIFKDRGMVISIVLWVIVVVCVLYII